MKKYISQLFIMTLLFSVFTACDREKLDYGLDGENPVIQGEGKVNFAFSLDVIETKAADVSIDDYIITILDSDQNPVGESYTYGQLPQEGIALNVGTYTIQAKSHANFDMSQTGNYAYYVGSEEFEIKKGEITTIDKLLCTMQNIKVEMVVAESLAEILDTYEVTATFKAGETVLSFSYDQSNTGDPFIFFPAINQSNILIVQLTGMSGTTKVDMSKTYTGVEAGDYRRITFIYSENIASGSADINLAIDALCEVVNRNIIVPGIDGGGTDPGTDPGDGSIEITGASNNGNPFNIDEAQHIPADDETEIIVNIMAAKGIQNLFVTIDSSILNIVLEGSGLDEEFDLVNPGELELVLGQGTEEAEGFGFPIKDEVYGETSIDFEITPFTGLLGLFGPSHNDFILRIVDLDGNEFQKTLTIVVE